MRQPKRASAANLAKTDPMPCSKKKMSKQDAENFVAMVAHGGLRGKAYRKEKRAYHCAGCNAWHTTHLPDVGTVPVVDAPVTLLDRWKKLF